MASNFKISTAQRDAACNAMVDRLDGGTGSARLEHRTGSPPTNVGDASTGTLLGTNTFSSTAFGASSTGVATAAAITSDTDADASGDAAYFRVYQGAAADTAAEWQGTSGEAADTPDLTFDNKTIVAGGTIAISGITLTMPVRIMKESTNPTLRVSISSFAPPLTSEKLERYGTLISGVKDPRIKDVMQRLHRCAVVFQETGESKLPGTPHPTGLTQVVPLEKTEIDRIWDDVPWDWECDAMSVLLGSLPEGGPRRVVDDSPKGYRIEFDKPLEAELRNAAFHLLWYARELTKDREPLTNDKLKKS